jgi:hypothetical protein
MGISYYLIIIFGLPLTYAYATLRQSVAGNSTFRGIVYCNLGTLKTVISNFVTTRQIETPYLPQYCTLFVVRRTNEHRNQRFKDHPRRRRRCVVVVVGLPSLLLSSRTAQSRCNEQPPQRQLVHASAVAAVV